LRANFGGVFATAFGQYDPPPNFHKAPELMVQRATEQLALLHGVTVESIPTPKVGAYADWSLEPFGGGWNFWQPQANVKDVMTKVKQPLGPQYPVYLVGEAYSGVQGWVEGALTVAELVLENQFGLPRPSWLPASYYLGW
jgi:monoamine oxidase